MSVRIFKILYLAGWAAFLVGIVYAATLMGRPWWHGAIAAFVVFRLGNGTLAYRYRAKQERLEGKEPQPYLSYLLLGQASPEHERVPRYLRTLVGLMAIASGLPLFALGCGLIVALLPVSFSFGAGAVVSILFVTLLLTALLGVGGALAYVGFRLIVGRDDETMMRRRASKPAVGAMTNAKKGA